MFIEKLFNSVNLWFYGIKLLINLKFIESVFLLTITSYFGENNRKLKIVGMVDKIFFNYVNWRTKYAKWNLSAVIIPSMDWENFFIFSP